MQDKTPLLYRMCLRKKMLSEELANKIILKAKENGKELYKYVCPYCGKYHLTSKPNTNDVKVDKNIYVLRVNNKKIFKIYKLDYENSKKRKDSDVLISKEKYDNIVRHNCNIVFTKEFPDMQSILEYCKESIDE